MVSIQAGWNTILVKVNQNDASYMPRLERQGNFWCRLGFEQADRMGQALSTPGLPLDEKPAAKDSATGVAMEVRLESIEGPVIGVFHYGQTETEADLRVADTATRNQRSESTEPRKQINQSEGPRHK